MDKRVKKLWVEALRSGEYRQANGALRGQVEDSTADCFCCLGVLCDLYRKHESRGGWIGSSFYVGKSGSMAQLPEPVRQWADLEQRDPHLGDDTAISLNDRGFSFTDIADRIEEYL